MFTAQPILIVNPYSSAQIGGCHNPYSNTGIGIDYVNNKVAPIEWGATQASYSSSITLESGFHPPSNPPGYTALYEDIEYVWRVYVQKNGLPLQNGKVKFWVSNVYRGYIDVYSGASQFFTLSDINDDDGYSNLTWGVVDYAIDMDTVQANYTTNFIIYNAPATTTSGVTVTTVDTSVPGGAVIVQYGEYLPMIMGLLLCVIPAFMGAMILKPAPILGGVLGGALGLGLSYLIKYNGENLLPLPIVIFIVVGMIFAVVFEVKPTGGGDSGKGGK